MNIREVMEMYGTNRVKRLIAGIPVETLNSYSEDELFAMFAEKLELRVPALIQSSVDDSIREIKGAHTVDSKASVGYSMTVEFSGDGNLYLVGSAVNSVLGEEIDAETRQLRMRLRGAGIQPAAAKSDFLRRLNYVEKELQQVSAYAEPWNRQELPRLFRQLVCLRKQQGVSQTTHTEAIEAEVFISHASEDKIDVAEPLYQMLTSMGYRVWYDRTALKLGDSLNTCISQALSKCRYGVVILSPDFFRKNWPQSELDGLMARQNASGKVIIPVWHRVDRDEVLKYSPILADKVAAHTSHGLDSVRDLIVEAIGPPDVPPRRFRNPLRT